MKDNGVAKEEIGYIGDDLNDLSPMMLCGYVACPADACEEVKEIADYVSLVKGGDGVVRDVIEHLLRESHEWKDVISCVYGIGV